ncbi:MAG: HAMP domain-containing histidine kinase, partial [Ruminococcaceae bacterium]|nr:HAMP domain-containing histidine kinase [Oscillospiraceae bacterium]
MKESFCKEDSKRETTKYRGMGIRWNLFAFLALFTVFVLLVVYIFQVLLLAPFYENEKKNELKLTASVIEANIKSDELKKTIYTLSGDYSICAILYDIDKGHAKELVSSHISSGCVIHNIDARNFGGLYNKALASDGEYMKTYSLDALSSTVYVKTINDDGKNYVLFLNADLAPVSAAIKTYTMQFRWISLILLIGALILSFFMSRVVGAPIIRLSRSVGRFAKGKYDEVFDGNGYKEIRELSDALNYASDELSKNDALKKELIANVSHDLRTPL